MVRFKVLKEKLMERGISGHYTNEDRIKFDFQIPIQIILEGYERGLGLGYLENKLREYTRRDIEGRGSDEIWIFFKKNEIHELPSIIKSLKERLELIIKKHAIDAEERNKQRIEDEEKEKQDLEEVKEKLEKLDFD